MTTLADQPENEEEARLRKKFIDFMGDACLDEFLEKLKSLKSVEEIFESTKAAFVSAICDPFQADVLKAVRNRLKSVSRADGQTVSELAIRYGVNKGNLSRWLKSDQRMSFTSLCMIATAEEVTISRGHADALNAYAIALNHAAASLDHPQAGRIEPAEYLATYFMHLSTTAAIAFLTKDPRSIQRAVREINDWLQEELPGTRFTPQELGSLVDTHKLTWLVITKDIPNGWF